MMVVGEGAIRGALVNCTSETFEMKPILPINYDDSKILGYHGRWGGWQVVDVL